MQLLSDKYRIDVERNDDGASMVVPFAINASVVPVSTALVARHHVSSQVQMRRPPTRIEVKVWPLERGIGVRGPIVVMHRVTIRLWGPMPVLAIDTEKVRADSALAT